MPIPDKKKKSDRPTGLVERRIWYMEKTLKRRAEKITRIRAAAEERVREIESKNAETKVLLDAMKRGALKLGT